MKHLITIYCGFTLLLSGFSAEPRHNEVTLEDFKLAGVFSGEQAVFTLTAIARVEGAKGGSLELLSGTVGLSDVTTSPKWKLLPAEDRFTAVFERGGKFPIQLKFNAAVRQSNGWNSVHFHVATSTLQPILLSGLPADSEFEFAGAARPERVGEDFQSYLPPDGEVKLSWKVARPETEGKLFYSAEMLSQISLSPGLLRQTALLEFKVMQGDLSRLEFSVEGKGEVTRVQGTQVLAWNLQALPGSAQRKLVVQFNQPQKERIALQIQMQTPLEQFPVAVDPMQLRPQGATRFAGYFRITNDGAVRLEVVQAGGLSQISPDQFPESDMTRANLSAGGNQRFVYRFSSAAYALRIQADQILPELSVAELLAYRLGENELVIDAEIELDIREAPIRELLLQVPRGYGVAQLTAANLTDYFLNEGGGPADTELRLVFGTPVAGRQALQLRLERNKALTENSWSLPRVAVEKAKSTRGHIAIAADPGFRLTPTGVENLTEIATAFFPRKVTGIQSAFRLSEANWQAQIRVERLAQTVQADALHLFSIGEGIAYGSSVLNYVISGAPLAAFKVDLSDEYYNVEFTGKDVRNWQKTADGYLVQLHAPVSGSYTLLATYERPFRPQGETLTFTGARPRDAQSEQGHTLIVSAYQFEVRPVDVSSGLLPLEPGEVPAEYRLMFDAPVLAAFRYIARPYNLKLALSPLTQADSLSQVVDRAWLNSRISKEGQVITEVRYFVKNRGNPRLRLTLPTGTQLWSATVNGMPVVPVLDGSTHLIGLPQAADPNAVVTLDLKLAARSKNARRIDIATPTVSAPITLAQWTLEPDAGQRLLYRGGSLTPVGGVPDDSGFAQLARWFSREQSGRPWILLLSCLLFLGSTLGLCRWAAGKGVYHLSARHLGGGLLVTATLTLAVVTFVTLLESVDDVKSASVRDVTFVAPVQQADTGLNVEVSNIPEQVGVGDVLEYGWPACAGILALALGRKSSRRPARLAFRTAGCLLLAWPVLRWPNGAVAFLLVIAVFLSWQVIIPSLCQLWRLPRRAQSPPPLPSQGGATSAAATLAVAALAVMNLAAASYGSEPGRSASAPVEAQTGKALINPSGLPESVDQDVRIEKAFAFATVKIRWHAEKGDILPLLYEPAVLTQISYPKEALKLMHQVVKNGSTPGTGVRVQELMAKKRGAFEIEAHYQLQVTARDSETGFSLPVQYGLANRLHLTLTNLDVDIRAPQAVALNCEHSGGTTVASLVLSPEKNAWVGWRPRDRDVKRESAVFYVESSQLYAPGAGVVEGVHLFSVRPSKGELKELIVAVPEGTTVIDVIDPKGSSSGSTGGSLVALWRFDPDKRRLRVPLSAPQSRPFALLIRTQVAAGPLPFEKTVGLLAVENAAEQIGLVGVATGNEVQLDDVRTVGLSAINLEDFPTTLGASLQSQIPGLTVRRAYRYGATIATASLKASPVEPDIRVESQDTVSLGEDRTVLAATVNVEITRAGIFRLSFVLPDRFDVESISGGALSHWTELRTDTGRVITLHLQSKTEGRQQFAINLTGPGVKATGAWQVPQLSLREASKQRGTLLIAPEQGLRLQVATTEGLTQLDPQKSGIKQKGVLAFRVLQTPSRLSLNIEQVNPWVQVTSLQHAEVNEAQIKVIANLQYQIENAGLKAFRVFLPTNAELARFQGDQISDFMQLPDVRTNGLQAWEIKLHRRVIGTYLLQASYQITPGERATEIILRGVQAAGVNLQRGFVTVQSSGRLQLRLDAVPASLQPAEWQSIPRDLQAGLRPNTANFSFRLVEPWFALPLKLERHEAARLLAARINSVTLTSVISDDGVMLTRARLEMFPGDKRLLKFTLPKGAHFWFAFVDQNGVWPWREQDRLLIPLDQPARSGQAMPVELLYTCKVGAARRQALNLRLLAPQFDLPLENITWRVSLSDKWQVANSSGSLQYAGEEILPQRATNDITKYVQAETEQQRERTRQAQEFLAVGNSALEQGNPQQARRAFQAAFGLSASDAAFNEDARVQLHNIKLQQALVGLNVRQEAATGDPATLGSKFRDFRGRKEINYTQQQAKDILERNSTDENAAFVKLAERLIQQQDAAVSSPTALHANLSEEGRVLTFKRAVLVDPWADLTLNLSVTASRLAPWLLRALILAGTALLAFTFTFINAKLRPPASLP